MYAILTIVYIQRAASPAARHWYPWNHKQALSTGGLNDDGSIGSRSKGVADPFRSK